MEIVSNFPADAALTLRKKRGFSVCSVAGSRSRNYQSNPHFPCGIALFPPGDEVRRAAPLVQMPQQSTAEHRRIRTDVRRQVRPTARVWHGSAVSLKAGSHCPVPRGCPPLLARQTGSCHHAPTSEQSEGRTIGKPNSECGKKCPCGWTPRPLRLWPQGLA